MEDYFQTFFIYLKTEKMTTNSTRPPGWKKTIKDVFDEYRSKKDKTVPMIELEWAADYESSLLPREYIFPKKGYVYEAIEDIDIELEIWYNAPGSGCDDAKLFKGEKIWVYSDTPDKSIEAYLQPVEYDKLETRLVSPSLRELPFYAGYSIPINTRILNEKFRLVEKDYCQE